MKQHTKSYGIKALGAGAEITSDVLAKINTFALTPLKAEEVYARKLLLAHNCVDRDNERFPDDMLDQFAATIVGKSLLVAHNRKETGSGLFFDASTEYMTPEQFTSLTGEAARLPDGTTQVKVLWAWFYTINTPSSEEWLKWIDAGIIRHCSIGFAAADIVSVKKEINGPTLYWEYVVPGEALEGSLVWLGAQPGAGTQKAMKDKDTINQEVASMKTIIALLFGLGMKTLTETATEDQIAAGIKSLIEEKDARIRELSGDAELGKAYREKLTGEYVTSKAKLGECDATPEAQTAMKAAASTFDVKFLESECKHLQARIEKAFPDTPQLQGEDGEKGRTTTDDNPLIPKEEK